MAPPRAKFAEGERILCFHGPLIYEAKCIKTRVKDSKNQYFVHYAGWNKNWDEFVPESRVLKYNDANMLKQKELMDAHYANVRAKKLAKADAKKRRTDAAAAAAAGGSPSMTAPATETATSARKREPSVSSVQSSDDGKRRRTRLDTPEQTQKAAPATEESRKPGEDTRKPGEDSKKPGDESRKPTEDSRKPGDDSRKPGEDSRKPGDDSRKPGDSSSETASDTEGRRRGGMKQEQTVETEEQFLTKVEVKIKLPDELKPWLVDDWDFVIRQNKLYQLPARVTAGQCIDE